MCQAFRTRYRELKCALHEIGTICCIRWPDILPTFASCCDPLRSTLSLLDMLSFLFFFAHSTKLLLPKIHFSGIFAFKFHCYGFCRLFESAKEYFLCVFFFSFVAYYCTSFIRISVFLEMLYTTQNCSAQYINYTIWIDSELRLFASDIFFNGGFLWGGGVVFIILGLKRRV